MLGKRINSFMLSEANILSDAEYKKVFSTIARIAKMGKFDEEHDFDARFDVVVKNDQEKVFTSVLKELEKLGKVKGGKYPNARTTTKHFDIRVGEYEDPKGALGIDFEVYWGPWYDYAVKNLSLNKRSLERLMKNDANNTLTSMLVKQMRSGKFEPMEKTLNAVIKKHKLK